jgi:hypothetical protein
MVDKGGLPMVNMGNNGNITDIGSTIHHTPVRSFKNENASRCIARGDQKLRN